MKPISTVNPGAPSPMDRLEFRAQATGGGNTVAAARRAGTWRTDRVIATMPEAQRKALPKHGGGYRPRIDPGTGMPFPDFVDSSTY